MRQIISSKLKVTSAKAQATAISVLLILLFSPDISLAQTEDVRALYGLVGSWYLGFLLPLGAVLAGIVILIAGIIYVSSGGDSTKTAKAKELIFGALTGLVILVCAALIMRTLLG